MSESKEVKNEMIEELYSLEPAYIQGYQYTFYSYEEMLKEAGDIVITESKLNPEILTGPGGVNDSRMGTLTMIDDCITCKGKNCPGHLGIIKFGEGKEIINPLMTRTVIQILNCVCHDCSRLLFCNELASNETKTKKGKKSEPVMSDELKRILKMSPSQPTRLALLEKYCNHIKVCTCDYVTKNCNIKPCSPHPKLKATSINEAGNIIYKMVEDKKEKGKKAKPTKEDEKGKVLFNKQIYTILKNISDEDAKILGFVGDTKPVNLILRGILVIPSLARPPITDKNGETLQNPITSLYVEVVKAVNRKDGTSEGIYKAVRNLIVKNDNHRRSGQEVKSTSELMQGKKGIYRFAMMGKRVDYCGRTVAGPGEHLKFGQEALPEEWTHILTKPRKITHFNIDFYQSLLNEKRLTHIIDEKGIRLPIDYTKPTIQLMIGQEVEVKMRNGDRVYLNRQPSLHKGSMQGFEAVFEPNNTIKSHLSITTSLNLDHDGDELNVWIPQDYNVEAEVEYVFNSKQCIISTATGKANMGLVMNSITALNLLSQSEVMEDLYFDLIGSITNKEGLVNLTERLNKFGFQLFRTDMHGQKWYLGRAAISALFPPTFEYRSKDLNIYEGILVSGVPTKSKGLHSGRSITQELIKHYSIDRGADFLTDAPFMANTYLAKHGFTVGYEDCLNMVVDSKAELLNLKYNPQVKQFHALYTQMLNIVFSTKTYSQLSQLTETINTIVTQMLKLETDPAFNTALQSALIQLNDIVSLMTGKRCDLRQVFASYSVFFETKKNEKSELDVWREEFETLVNQLKDESVADALVFRLRMALNVMTLMHLLVGEDPATFVSKMTLMINNLKLADNRQVMNQVIGDIFDILQNLRKTTKKVASVNEAKKLLHDIENTLKLYQQEKIYTQARYLQFHGYLRQLKELTMSRDLALLVNHFFESIENGILREFLNVEAPKVRIVDDIQILYTLYNTVAKAADDYQLIVRQFVSRVVENLHDCQESDNKQKATLGVYNEQLLMILALMFKNLKNLQNREYNRNFVTKKEELAKLSIELEAMNIKDTNNLNPKEAQFNEMLLVEKLNNAKSLGLRLAGEMSKSNAILTQTELGAGTKGGAANYGQITGLFAQTSMGGERLWMTKDRLSSHFDPNDLDPVSKGFVESSFLEGLSPTENFFVSAQSQESVVISGLSVATVGKMQRFMQRAFENVVMAYDGSVRNSQGFLYSTSYNNGFNISKTLPIDNPIKPGLSNFIDINILIDQRNHATGWYSRVELKNTNRQPPMVKLSLEEEFTNMINTNETVEPVAIESKNQNPELKLTYFEKARIIGTRANQLNNNAIPRIKNTDLVEPFEIAKREYEEGLLAEYPALFIVRTMPDGSTVRVYPTLQNIS